MQDEEERPTQKKRPASVFFGSSHARRDFALLKREHYLKRLMASIRTILADDHTLTRAGLRLLLEQIPDVEVLEESANGREAAALAKKYDRTHQLASGGELV